MAAIDWQIKRFWQEFEPAAKYTGAATRIMPHCYAELPPLEGTTERPTVLYGVTAKSLDSISAFHPTFIYVDEAAMFSPQAWNRIRIRLLGGRGAVILSTPRPNFWAKIAEWGRARRHKKWCYVHCTTEEAGILNPQEIELLKEDLPAALFDQEVLAKVVADAGAVFPNVGTVAVGAIEKPREGVRYIVTYDPAKFRDYAVVAVWRGLKQVFAQRWQKMNYTVQVPLVADVAVEYNMADIIMDSQGPGEAPFEMLEDESITRVNKETGEGFYVTGVKWDNALKGRLVKDAIIAFERKHIELVDPEHGEVYSTFVNEHQRFEQRRSPSGISYTYNAPPGEHDDCVSNTLLLMHGVRSPQITHIEPEKEKREEDAAGDGRTRTPRITVIR